MEIWTDLLWERSVQAKEGERIPELLARLSCAGQDFALIARKITREKRFDDCFVDVLDEPPRQMTFGGVKAHVITHSMHHRAQIMWLMERAGLTEHIEGDVLNWESHAFGWG